MKRVRKTRNPQAHKLQPRQVRRVNLQRTDSTDVGRLPCNADAAAD
jgi:hypothetical protein